MEGPPDVLPEVLPDEPMRLVSDWLDHAWKVRPQPNPHAIVLATCDKDGQPAARVVLCKKIDVQDGFIVFYTNYQSRKGRDLDANDRAAAVFFWDALHRQIRIEGRVEKTSAEDSDRYFAERGWEKQLGACASDQSSPVASRSVMRDKVRATARELGLLDLDERWPESEPDIVIPRPAHWGGYRLWAESVEIWTEGEGRIHDRGLWTRNLDHPDPEARRIWDVGRLQP